MEELLVERGIEVEHVTVYRWVQRFTPLLADAAQFARHSPGDRWFVDKTYVKVNGVWRYTYRTVDQYGQVIDVLLSVRRGAQPARQFFTRALRTLKVIPSEVVTDAAPVYPAVLDELLPSAWHHATLCSTRSSRAPRRRSTTPTPPGSADRPAPYGSGRKDRPPGLASTSVTARDSSSSATAHARRHDR